MKIGLFTHSGNPRGGVVHALSVGAALAEAGHEVSVLAPLGSRGFFRTPRCRQVAMPVAAMATGARGSAERIGRQIGLLVQFLTASGTPRFDVWHAGDPITANALGALVRLGAIDGFSRTVHHLDSFADPMLSAWQEAAVRDAGALCCVSGLYQARLAAEFGREAALVGNGVDRTRFSPASTDVEAEALARRRWPDGNGPRLLAFGGIEARKNTLGVLAGFIEARKHLPGATLLVAGGATLLDHAAYHARFQAQLAASGLAGAVRVAGVVPDAEVPALYRAADMLVSPSLAEGFGLAAIEAMACGVPVVVAARPPFTEHLRPGECLFVDPEDGAAIGRAVVQAARPETRLQLAAAGIAAAARFDWRDVAMRHLPVFALMGGRQAAHA